MTTTWNPADKNSNITLSNGNLTAVGTGSNTDQLVRSTSSKTSGLYYMEFVFVNPGTGECAVGFADSTESLSNYLGKTSHSLAWYCANQGYYTNASSLGTFSAPNWSGTSSTFTLSVALDLTHSVMWGGVNGSWGGSNNPATDTGGCSFSGHFSPSGGIYIATDIPDPSGTSVTMHIPSNSWSYSAPSGFSEWDSGGVVFDASKGMFRLAGL